MKLFNKFEITGVLNAIEIRTSANGSTYANGIIASYELTEQGKKKNYFSIPFLGFNDVADKIIDLELEKGDTVHAFGSLEQSTYNDKTTIKLFVSSMQEVSRAPRQENDDEFYQPPKKQQTTQKPRTQPKEQIIEITDDDMPF